jgi:hypothetical protein
MHLRQYQRVPALGGKLAEGQKETPHYGRDINSQDAFAARRFAFLMKAQKIPQALQHFQESMNLGTQSLRALFEGEGVALSRSFQGCLRSFQLRF